MKNMRNFLSILLVLMAFTACSEDDNNVETKEPNPNVSAENMNNKSGGVYFVATPAGEYIFRLGMKNSNDEILCQMFHEDSYSTLNPEDVPDWEPGEELTGLIFSNKNLTLNISLQEDGTESTQLFVKEEEMETISFKSTQDKPVLIYSGHTVSYYTKNHNEENSNRTKEMMVLQNDNYFYGMKTGEDQPYLKIHTQLTEKTSNEITYNVPDDENGIYTWERAGVQYNEDLIHWSFEDDNEFEYFYTELNLFRRFKN
jgi:hypothetical protein